MSANISTTAPIAWAPILWSVASSVDSWQGLSRCATRKNVAAPDGDGGHAAELTRQSEINEKLLNNEGTENPFKLWRELGQTTTEHATVIRYNKGLRQADQKIVELLDRFKKVNLADRSQVGQHQLRLRPPVEKHAGAVARRRAGSDTPR